MTQNLEHLLDLVIAAEHRRHLVLARQQIQVSGEMLQERRQLEALLQPLFAQLHVAHARAEA